MKIDVIVVSHAGLAGAFAEAAEMIMGPQPNLKTVGFYQGGDLMETANRVADMVKGGEADFTVILTDLFGATPTNLALLAISQCENAAVVTGVNLISLIQALEMDGEDLNTEEVLQRIEAEGRDGIRILTRESIS